MFLSAELWCVQSHRLKLVLILRSDIEGLVTKNKTGTRTPKRQQIDRNKAVTRRATDVFVSLPVREREVSHLSKHYFPVPSLRPQHGWMPCPNIKQGPISYNGR